MACSAGSCTNTSELVHERTFLHPAPSRIAHSALGWAALSIASRCWHKLTECSCAAARLGSSPDPQARHALIASARSRWFVFTIRLAGGKVVEHWLLAVLAADTLLFLAVGTTTLCWTACSWRAGDPADRLPGLPPGWGAAAAVVLADCAGPPRARGPRRDTRHPRPARPSLLRDHRGGRPRRPRD